MSFQKDVLSEKEFGKHIEIRNNIFPDFDFEDKDDWDINNFIEDAELNYKDDFLPCVYLFFIENGKQIGIVKGNFSKLSTGIEYIQTKNNKQGDGKKILNKLKEIGISEIYGYSLEEAIPFWSKMGVEFSDRLMFGCYPSFKMNLQKMY